MRNGKLRGLLITVMLLVFLAGLASILYPYIWGAAVDSSIASIAKDFLEREESALAELRSATSCFETVLHETEARFCLILRGFSSFLLFVHQFLNPRFCRPLSDFNPNLFLMCRLLC